jgi:hypothetical protein
MDHYLTLYMVNTSSTYTYTDLAEGHALTLIRMVERTSGDVLIADASPELGPHIHPRIRTSWYTRDLPEES